jgi:uncharacterized protein YndB with AHSA1/START domain
MRNALSDEFGMLRDEHSVHFERVLPGSMALVWCYLTKKELLATWMGEGTFECRIGGNVRLYTAETSIGGVVTNCRPYSRLGYSWTALPNSGSFDGAIGWESYVSLDLRPKGSRVLLKLTHTPVPSASSPRVLALWHALLDRLEASILLLEPENLMRRYARVLPKYERRVMGPFAEKCEPCCMERARALVPALQS